MTARFTRLTRCWLLEPILGPRRKPGILPMSAADERIHAELHRRREARRALRNDGNERRGQER